MAEVKVTEKAPASRTPAFLMVLIGVVASNFVAVLVALSYSASRKNFVFSTGWEKLMSITFGVGGIGIMLVMAILIVLVLYLIISEKFPVRLRWLIGLALVATLLLLAPHIEFNGMFSWMSFIVTVGALVFVFGLTWYFMHVTRRSNPNNKEEVKKDA